MLNILCVVSISVRMMFAALSVNVVLLFLFMLSDMKAIVLNRYYRNKKALFGFINILEEKFYTLENFEYRVPDGRYKIVKEFSPRFHRDLWSIVVNGRSGIRLHPANFACELRGCIACGIPNSSVSPHYIADSLRCTSELEYFLDLFKPDCIIIKSIY